MVTGSIKTFSDDKFMTAINRQYKDDIKGRLRCRVEAIISNQD